MTSSIADHVQADLVTRGGGRQSQIRGGNQLTRKFPVVKKLNPMYEGILKLWGAWPPSPTPPLCARPLD